MARTVDWMARLGARLAAAAEAQSPQTPPGLPLGPTLARNAFFAAAVLAHGFRRLLPPY